MPATATQYGATTLAQRLDPTWSIDAMVRYIRDIWQMIGLRASPGVLDKQMLCDASYNAGQGRVLGLCGRRGYGWSWVVAELPRETQLYSPSIQKWKLQFERE